MIEHFGVKAGHVIVGLIGSVVSLTLMRELTPWRALCAVGSGTAAATFVTPWLADYLAAGEPLERALAFLVGLFGMNVLAGVFKMSERFREKPTETAKDLKDIIR